MQEYLVPQVLEIQSDPKGSLCCFSVAKSCPPLCGPMDSSMLGFLSFTVSRSLLKLMPIESMMPSNRLILHHPLLLLPSVFPSIRVFSNELALHIRCLKFWSFSFNISPSNEYSGLISFQIDWVGLLAVQRTVNSFPVMLNHYELIGSSPNSLPYRI